MKPKRRDILFHYAQARRAVERIAAIFDGATTASLEPLDPTEAAVLAEAKRTFPHLWAGGAA